MAASSTRLLSLTTVIKTYENWLHYGTFVHGPLKESLRDVLHNVSNDTTYQGLPIRPADLYRELDQNHKSTLIKLLKNGVLKQDQMLLIFPPNSNETHSDKFDVTLLAILIINCTTLTPPSTGWRNKNPPAADQSKAANVIRARELRNLFHHIDPKDFDMKIFDDNWMEGEGVVQGLGYNRYDLQALKTASLDPTRLSVVHSLVQFLQIEQNKLKKQIDLINAEEIMLKVEYNKKNVEHNRMNGEDNKKNVEENRMKFEENKKNIEDNRKNVEDNRKNVEDYKRNVEHNRMNVEDNKKNVEENRMNVEEYKKNVEDNRMNVEDNKNNIEDNRKNVEDYKKNVEDNRMNVVDIKKNIEDNRKNEEQNAEEIKNNAMEQLQHILKLETDLLGADKQICHLREQSDELKNRIISLRYNQSGT